MIKGLPIKKESIIILISIFIILTFLITVTSLNTVPSSDNNSSGEVLGNKSYGYVEKGVYGNLSASQTIVIITGVHPRESGFHNVTATVLKDKSSSLSKKYVLYRIHVTESPMHFTIGRMNGQLLANYFVVPDVIKVNPQFVVDIHEDLWTEAGYKYPRFIYPISKDNVTKNYLNTIIQSMPFLKIYSPGGSSPKYVTKPISKAGIRAMVYETYKKDSYEKKYRDANTFIDILDKL